MAPSTKALQAAFPRLSRGDALRIRTAIDVHNPQRAIQRIDEILGTHGVEYIGPGHNAKSPAIYYCNTGDSYGTTIMLVNGNFRIGSWGDIVERGNYD